MAVNEDGISPEMFYGAKSGAQVRIEAILKKSNESSSFKRYPDFMTQLLGPSRTWKVFKKQQEAIDFCIQRRNGLMCFAFEQNEGRRLFLVAHPKVFWAVNSCRFFKDCSTYEVIQQYAACKLYLDIEFEFKYNSQDLVGDRMLNNLLQIINFRLHEDYNVKCGIDDILNLDSSTDKKYSHHIIYQIPHVAFQNNYCVGYFVQKILTELKKAYEYYVSGVKDEMDILANKYGLKVKDILEFFVCDNKGKTKLFVDEGVYTKNRHFRLLGSTKRNKNTPLVVCPKNRYKTQSGHCYNLDIFLDSLITYFTTEVTRILVHEDHERYKTKIDTNPKRFICKVDELSCSQYPVIDSFILKLISPSGKIRRKSFFSPNSKIIYDICGYRYCDNIMRHHKSNNIMFIVDLKNLTYYQKCYDSDCANFKSIEKKLPDEICFLLEDDSEFSYFGLSADKNEDAGENENLSELSEILCCIEALAKDPDF